MRRMVILLSLLGLAGCSMTQPVQGSMNNGKEPFLGEATGYLTGNGQLTITTEGGVNCAGKFQYTSSGASGTGTFNCDDGRSGNFRFTSNGVQGQGFGKTSKGEPFRFTFGQPDATIRSW